MSDAAKRLDDTCLRIVHTTTHPCPSCGLAMERRAGMFYWRGQSFSGLVCAPCNSLWDDPEDSFEKHVGLK